MSRPEVQAPPEIFYNDVEARKYTSSSRIIEIQAKLSERAVELLALPDDGVPRLLLDIGNCFFHLCPSKSLPELISQGSYFLISQGQSVKPISSPVPNEWFPTLAVFMLAIGLIVTASFFMVMLGK